MRTAEEIETQIAKLVFGLTGDQVVEIGVGLVARGIYRVRENKGSAEAAGVASSVVSVFSGTHIDLLRASAAPPAPPSGD